MSTLKASRMVQLTRINHIPLVLNSDLIELIEITPDTVISLTVISLTNGQKLMVLETPEEIVRKVIEFRRAINSGISPAVAA
jgi:flagellar protein FlbD